MLRFHTSADFRENRNRATNLKMNPLFEIREVGLDVVAAMHIGDAIKQNKGWNCSCAACQYTRNESRVVEAIFKAWKKDVKTKDNLN